MRGQDLRDNLWSPMAIEVGFRQEQGRRPYQEDELLLAPHDAAVSGEERLERQTHLFGVFDGHAGESHLFSVVS